MPSSDSRDPVDILAEEFADRIRRGEHPSVSDYASAHPEHADLLRELLPAVAQMEMLKRYRHPAADKTLPNRFGDFRIIRELGRGGMGVVFEAVQESLGRPVALKVLARHAQFDTTRRERFVREAQAAAKLHHTNIVPVFGVGEQDGMPYYAMQLILGCGLHSVTAKWRKDTGHKRRGSYPTHEAAKGETHCGNEGTKPEGESGPAPAEAKVRAPGYGDWRFVAEVAVQAAYALHYAHKQGVLHRDVKPANLIYDGEIVWVADFGLAKLTDIEGLTVTGDILGTLQYLPPECLTGVADARSDVYGLGATLYELITLDPPYTADSPARLIKQVADYDPPPPRTINPNIPRDLETIVMKAMSREPDRRYATARELAQDLEAFLEDRPIKARRISVLSRAWRWCRRNSAVASLTLSTVAALSVAAVAGWVGYIHAEERRTAAEQDRKDAERDRKAAMAAELQEHQAKEKAEETAKELKANLDLSLAALDELFIAAGGTDRQGYGIPLPPPDRGFGGPGGPKGPGGPDGPFGPPPKKDGFGPPPKKDGPGGLAGTTSDKAAILEVVLKFYDKFAEQNKKQNPQTESLQFEAARASRRMCEAYVIMLKKPDKAIPAFRRAVALLEPLVAREPKNEAWRAELVMTYAVAPPEAFPKDRDAPMKRAFELAKGNDWLTGLLKLREGFARDRAGDSIGAEALYDEAIEFLTTASRAIVPPQGEEPASARYPQAPVDLASARHQLANLFLKQEKAQEARELLEKSATEFRPFVAKLRPEFHVGREWLGHTYSKLAEACRTLGDYEGEKRAYRLAGECGEMFRPGSPFGPPGGRKEGPPKGGKGEPPPFGSKRDGPMD
jgi:eukaryotic-like serine/threonine-protein kinase